MSKTSKNRFDDIKMMIATISITMTIVFWNLFASTPSQEETVSAAVNAPQAITAPVGAAEPTPTFTGKILLGGQAPQPQVIVRSGGGGRTVTRTRSS